MDPTNRPPSTLPYLDLTHPHPFREPQKLINEGEDVSHFLVSKAYRDIGLFLLQLNRSVCPRHTTTITSDAVPTTTETRPATNTPPLAPPPPKTPPTTLDSEAEANDITSFPIPPSKPPSEYPESIARIRTVFQKLESYLALAPPDPGPRRFGNVAFRTWMGMVEDKADELIRGCLPPRLLPLCGEVQGNSNGNNAITGTQSADEDEENVGEGGGERGKRRGGGGNEREPTLLTELRPYFLGSFGSPQRLDNGTGHELSFLAFLACLWKLGVFKPTPSSSSSPDPTNDNTATTEEESISRTIVLDLLPPYLSLSRHLIQNYTLEPAGSHGVWGLDDHSFIPYIFGSAQLSAPLPTPSSPMTILGSTPKAPPTSAIVDPKTISCLRESNFYFAAIGFIGDVKTGPFWEHSPVLFDISGVRDGWGKINKGMLKMYNAEVLSKFPVVQHFPFGSLFSWERDPEAVGMRESVHIAAHGSGSASLRLGSSGGTGAVAGAGRGGGGVGARAGISSVSVESVNHASAMGWGGRDVPGGGTRAPRVGTRAPGAGGGGGGTMAPTAAPWATAGAGAMGMGMGMGIAYSRVPPPPSTAAPGRRPPGRGGATGATASANAEGAAGGGGMPMTKAPWAK